MAHEKNHDYHILNPSLWPFLSALGAFILLFGSVLFMHGGSVFIAALGLLVVLYCMFAWWSDVVFESTDGDHTPCLLYTSPSPRDHTRSRMPSSA